ncbi:sigma-54 dependent transcriptional regulator [Bacillus sp. REN10]|uniref:sigma-54-dependent transcriptional regulator n=1 Tax=Bacillus sp. REN10 TaxID=2782541 RepID=UPI00193C258D|nr:sigma-54 dependent transcriptional regulator [Bacillus sp. REN10]
MAHILIIDDEIEVGRFLTHLLAEKGHQVTHGVSGSEFDQLVADQRFDLAFIDVRLPDRNGLDILRALRSAQPHCQSVIMTGYSTVKMAVEAIQIGASDFIEKPFVDITEIEKLAEQLIDTQLPSSHQEVLHIAKKLNCFIGNNPQMRQLFMLAYKFAQKNITVLIQGETGTGKEVLAHFIHEASKRAKEPFVGINCGAISESLLESELFGHTKGAFTGALKDRKGYFEVASKGTLFLDEVGEASASVQVKLLRVLETGEYMKVGSEITERTHTRLIAATHVDLHEAVKEKIFREDLLYRLDVIKLTIPPLRERKDDLPALIDFYFKQANVSLTFSQEAMSILCDYDWPGNVRELVNVLKRTIALADGEMTVIPPELLPEKLLRRPVAASLPLPAANFETYVQTWQQQLLEAWHSPEETKLDDIQQKIKQLEREAMKAFIMKSLKETLGNRKEASKRLGISTRQLRYLLNEKKK